MRITSFLLVSLIACGNSEKPPAEPAPAASSAAPAPSTAPVASDSAAPAASATPAPSASVAPPPAFTKTLKQLVGDAKIIKLTWREKMDSNEAKVVTIRTAATIKAILDAMGPDQVPSGSSPAYMSTFQFRFEDAKENPIATVSLYASDNMADENKKYGRIDTADGTYAGLTVAKYDELQKKLKSIGVKLP